MRGSNLSYHRLRLGQAAPVFGGTAVLVLAASRLVTAPQLGALLTGFGGVCLAALVGIGAWGRVAAWRGGARRDGAAAAVASSQDIAFVTDHRRCIQAASDPALRDFAVATGTTLDHIFADKLAEPAAVFDKLWTDAATGQVPKGHAFADTGPYRLLLQVADPDCLIWTCVPRADGGGDLQLPDAVAACVVDAEGVVQQANALLIKLLGERPAHLADIIEIPPHSAKEPTRIRTAAGWADHSVTEIAAPDGMSRLIMLTPAPVTALPVETDWEAIEDLPVPLLKVTDDGRLAASNREARKLLNIATSEGRQLSDVLDGPGRPINDWLAQALGGQGVHVSEFLRGRGDNRETFVQVTLSTAGAGDDRHLIAVLNDVTELKTLEAQFVQSQKMQAIGQLAGGVAHDFNNLLTAISGHCDLLLLRHDEGHQNYADLIQIHQNANRAASLVGQLLAFSRKQNLQLETIDLRATLADLTHLLNRLVGEKVTLSLEHEAELGPIRADRRQLEQVLMNLVVNARDAMQGAGEIRVVTSNMTLTAQMRKDRVVVPPGEYVVVNVIDEGSGIAPEKLPKIFEPFYTTKRTGEGTGLGLSTVYGIVKQTGGYVFVESTVDKGSTFSLVFPRQAKIADTTALLPPAPVTPQLGGRAEGVVLLVEDESPVRAFASRALRLKGYTVLEAESAEAALDMLEDEGLHVDIFVTDVIMPGLDGPTWVRRALKLRPDTQVVFVSGYPEDAFEDGEEPIPNAVFLPKPFSLTSLTQTVQTQLHKDLVTA